MTGNEDKWLCYCYLMCGVDRTGKDQIYSTLMHNKRESGSLLKFTVSRLLPHLKENIWTSEACA